MNFLFSIETIKIIKWCVSMKRYIDVIKKVISAEEMLSSNGFGEEVARTIIRRYTYAKMKA